jgi:mRNA-degrading endonuclease RelE of RelBE toxin-antitoxin system
MPRFTIVYTNAAAGDFALLRKHDQVLVVDAIDSQLAEQPLVETRNREQLRPNDLSKWELRVRQFRVFYDVDEEAATVTIAAVGWKEHDRYYIHGREFRL